MKVPSINMIRTDLLLLAARNVRLIQNKILLTVEKTLLNRRNNSEGFVGVTGTPVVARHCTLFLTIVHNYTVYQRT